MNFRTYSDLAKTINLNIHKISNDIDLIVGIPRSGILPATMISLLKNIPLVDLQSFCNNQIYKYGTTKVRHTWIKNISEAKKILVVEDSCSTGTSINMAREQISLLNLSAEIIYLSIYCTFDSTTYVDLYFEIVEQPRMFEWNYLHHSYIENACFDIDGVLCIDPTDIQNDDGENYLDFIRNADSRIIPTRKIGYLVTSRLEKYREETDFWMKKNSIEYNTMYMMQYKNKEERIEKGNHGEFKGEIYKSLKNAVIFIESDPMQAEIINKISKKPVFCIGNQQFYPEQGLNHIVKTVK